MKSIQTQEIEKKLNLERALAHQSRTSRFGNEVVDDYGREKRKVNDTRKSEEELKILSDRVKAKVAKLDLLGLTKAANVTNTNTN